MQRLSLSTLLAAAVLPVAASAQRPAASPAASSAPIAALPYSRHVLPNGLVVILNEDHASPIVAYDLYYKVGSRDDTPGRYGIAHFCEHVMGEGSPGLDQRIPNFYQSLGGTSPHMAATTEDITHYYASFPANQLETVLWVEGDRMARPFSKADSAHVAAVRGVVAQERQQQKEGQRFGTARDIVSQTQFAEGTPYWVSGASPVPDFPKITARDVKEACGPYYVPNNAVLGISGDFKTATVLEWVKKYFGSIPRGAKVTRTPVPESKIAADKRLVLEDYRVSTPQLRISWSGASYNDADRMALIALGSALSLGRFAADGHLQVTGVEPPTALGRLSKVLINDRHLATGVIVDNYDLEFSGLFEIAVFPQTGASLTTIETVVDSVVASLATNPITTQELTLFNAYNGVFLQNSLQPRFMRADTLAHDEIFAAGDPSAYVKQANAARALTPADIDRVRKRFLTGGRIILNMIPAGKLDLIAKPDLPFTNVTPPWARAQKPATP